MANAKTKEEFISAYEWHVNSMSYLGWSIETLEELKELHELMDKLKALVNKTADRVYDKEKNQS